MTAPVTSPELLGDVLPPLHETHEAEEDDIEGRAHDKLVQHDLLDNGDGGLTHEPGVQPAVPVVQDHGQHQCASNPVSTEYKFVNMLDHISTISPEYWPRVVAPVLSLLALGPDEHDGLLQEL